MSAKIPKIVVDTNIFISAAILKGVSAGLMDYWKEERFIWLFSAEIFDEYFEVIARPKFGQEEKDIRELSDILTTKAVAVEPNIKVNIVKEDPDDNKFLECAIAGEADYIVSGDRHLLALGEYKGIPILTLKELLERI